jgi:hypothetical protein
LENIKNTIFVFLFTLIGLLLILYITGSIKRVSQSNSMVVERLGRFRRVIFGGVHIIFPFIDSTRKIIWKVVNVDKMGNASIINSLTEYVDLRSQIIRTPKQNIITKDEVSLWLDLVITFKIANVVDVAYEITNIFEGIELLSQAVTRNVCGQFTSEEISNSKLATNRILTIVQHSAEKWGVVVEDITIREVGLSPKNDDQRNITLTMKKNKLLKVFICYASEDLKKATDLYSKLNSKNVEPWIDKMKLLPGQEWGSTIKKVIKNSDATIVCLSKASITKRSFLNKEIKEALDLANEQPQDSISIIPVKLEECAIPDQLQMYQWVDLNDKDGFDRLMLALKVRATQLDIPLEL